LSAGIQKRCTGPGCRSFFNKLCSFVRRRWFDKVKITTGKCFSSIAYSQLLQRGKVLSHFSGDKFTQQNYLYLKNNSGKLWLSLPGDGQPVVMED